jgi:hypothetical protein
MWSVHRQTGRRGSPWREVYRGAEDRARERFRRERQRLGQGGHLLLVSPDPARRIVAREHFRIAYSRRPDDLGSATEAIAGATAAEFGAQNVSYAASPRRGEPPDFPVLDRDGSSVSSLSLSEVLTKLPASRDEYVFVEPSLREPAKRWIAEHRGEIIEQAVAEQAREEEVSS